MDLFDHLVDIEFTSFFSDPREERNLKEQVAQLFAQIVRASESRFFQRVKCFVGFLQKFDRLEPVPFLHLHPALKYAEVGSGESRLAEQIDGILRVRSAAGGGEELRPIPV